VLSEILVKRLNELLSVTKYKGFGYVGDEPSEVYFHLSELAPSIPEYPDVPVEPELPEEPEEPLVPEDPEEPEDPVLPEEPLVPEDPEEPEDPEDPDVPEDPLTPDVPEDPLVPEDPVQSPLTSTVYEKTEPGATTGSPAEQILKFPDPNSLTKTLEVPLVELG
jgi:hypothetical protein